MNNPSKHHMGDSAQSDGFDLDDTSVVNPIESILKVTKKTAPKSEKIDSKPVKSGLVQPSLEKLSLKLNKNVNRKIQFFSSINGTSINDPLPSLYKVNDANIPSPPKPEPTKLVTLNENSIKRIRKLLNLDPIEACQPTTSRPNAIKSRRVPKKTSTFIPPPQQHDLIVINASSIGANPQSKSVQSSLSSSSSSNRTQTTTNDDEDTVPYHIKPIRRVYMSFGRRREEETLSTLVPPSTPLVYSLEDSVLLDECFVCKQERMEEHHECGQSSRRKNERVLVPKISSSLMGLNTKQYI